MAGPDHDGVAVDRHGAAEVVLLRCVGGRQLYLCVRGPVVVRSEDVGRARIGAVVVVAVGPDHDGGAVDGHRDAERVAVC